MIRTNSLLPVLGCLVLALLVGLGAGYLARERALDALLVSGEADARIRQALIESEVARYRLLPLALADDRDVIAAERGESDAAVAVLNGKLKDLAQTTGASAIYVVNRAGRAIAASNWDKPYSFVGSNYSFRRYIREAQNSGAGRQFALGTVSRKPGLYLAQRTRGGGAVVVKLEFDWIEDQWRQAGGITFVTNSMGVIFVTSRPAWRFAATRELNAQERAQTQRDSGAKAIHPRPWDQRRDGLLEVPGREGPFVRIDTPGGNEGWQLFLLLPAKGAVAGQARLVGVTAGGGALVV
ncbi:MAG: sensor histidine kinase, partial [Pseudomonadota bacterium]|nr:sensor histidine kinase [Pseudomonadota bacterium]